MRPLLTCVEIDGIVHERASGEGGLTRCRMLFVEESDTSDHWLKHGWRIGQLLTEDATIDCMSCLVRRARCRA